ncbi:MAG: vWA domain-containing protein [Candidatus Paceibacterota bacterium]|jgi:hypothetical protein
MPTNKQLKTDITVILDRSGSMERTAADTIRGFNSFLAEQQSAPGVAKMTTILFNDRIKVLDDASPVEKVKPLDSASYRPTSNTALYDAIGYGVTEAEKRVGKKDRIVQIVIITDGQENASQTWTSSSIEELLQKAQANGWQVLFLAANQDAILTGGALGLARSQTMTYRADRDGTQALYATAARSTINMRDAAMSGASLHSAIAQSGISDADRDAQHA